MQLPEQLLAAKLPASAKAVLAALWQRADGEPPWTAPRLTDLASASGLSISRVKAMLTLLRERGAVRRETREVAGRRMNGFGLSRSLTPLRSTVPRTAPTTPASGTAPVVRREKSHRLVVGKRVAEGLSSQEVKLLREDLEGSFGGVGLVVVLQQQTAPQARIVLEVREVVAGGPAARAGVKAGDIIAAIEGVPIGQFFHPRQALARVRGAPRTRVSLSVESSRPSRASPTRTIADDLVAIARVAGRGDSEARIALLLNRADAPCSEGRRWYAVKVHRRIALMRSELGITSKASMRAGDVVARWKVVAEAQAKRRTTSPATPDAPLDFSGESLRDLEDEEPQLERPALRRGGTS